MGRILAEGVGKKVSATSAISASRALNLLLHLGKDLGDRSMRLALLQLAYLLAQITDCP